MQFVYLNQHSTRRLLFEGDLLAMLAKPAWPANMAFTARVSRQAMPDRPADMACK
jgi:hypothetical protein